MLVDLSFVVVALASTALAYPAGQHSQLEARAPVDNTLSPATGGDAFETSQWYLASTSMLRE